VLPNVENILKFSEENLYQAEVHAHIVDLQHLDDIVERANSRSYTQGIDVAKMNTTLRNWKVNQDSTHWVWLFDIIIASKGCGALWPVWIKFIKGHCPWIRKCITRNLQPTMTSTARKLNENKTKLQVLQKEDGAVGEEVTPRTSSGDDSKTQSTLAGFVRTGRLPVDPL